MAERPLGGEIESSKVSELLRSQSGIAAGRNPQLDRLIELVSSKLDVQKLGDLLHESHGDVGKAAEGLIGSEASTYQKQLDRAAKDIDAFTHDFPANPHCGISAVVGHGSRIRPH